MEAYWDGVKEMTAAGGFQIAGHLDLLKKNNQDERWFSLHDKAYQDKVGQSLDLIAAAPLIVEVNTGGLNRKTVKEIYPAPWILDLLKERSIPVLISPDAHRVGHLDGGRDEARKALVKAGYTHIKRLTASEGAPIWTEDSLA
jgi:histidinol-phosphatase (PHP family)